MLRIAWLGIPGTGSGVPGMAGLLIEGLLLHSIQIDCYGTEKPPEKFLGNDKLIFISTPTQWEWGRWYSSKPFLAFLSGALARKQAHAQLCDMLIENHAEHPYDLILQFSQTELFKLGQNLHKLPPVIIFPCVHAAGELRWHRQESTYALQSESFWMHYLVRAILIYRSWGQKRQSHKPTLIIGMSQRFNNLVAADYNVSPNHQAVIYQPILPQSEENVRDANDAAVRRTIVKLLFIGRISVRKGLQYIVELSQRLDDLSGQIQIDIIGGYTQWSDYRAHLKELNPKTAQYLGEMTHSEIMTAYDSADILLIPSLYEPGGIVVGEALSRGLCVVASDAIGSAEVIDGDCHRPFPVGDMDAFERQVRQLIEDLKTRRQELRQCAREQAQKHFDPDTIAKDLFHLFERVVSDYAIKTD
jgi:glycosyltransferase involved in cell wall biosynthesis